MRVVRMRYWLDQYQNALDKAGQFSFHTELLIVLNSFIKKRFMTKSSDNGLTARDLLSGQASKLYSRTGKHLLPGGPIKNGATLHFPEYLKKKLKIFTRFFAHIKASVY